MGYQVYDAGKEAVPIKAWTEGVPVEYGAINQLMNTARLPFIFKHVAAMPDVHVGIGATVGSVIPTKGAIIPAAVGVDIGCGMVAVRLAGVTQEDLPDSLKQLREGVEQAVPVGFAKHNAPPAGVEPLPFQQLDELLVRHPKIGAKRKHRPISDAILQLATLGGGNHFIELCIDELGSLWIMLHSGSRGIGNVLGQYFIEMAREDMRRHFINLPDKDLAYFPEGTDHFNDYVAAVSWAQHYAKVNRSGMMFAVVKAITPYLPHFNLSVEAVDCHHNYVERENHFGENVWVTRKGAVRARIGDMGIIPGSMGARSFIVRGKGNMDSFQSCSHGAGRVMSRTAARSRITTEDHVVATQGIECRKDSGVLDESPAAYKSIDAVMAAQEDLVEVVHELKQVLCVKG